MIPVEPLRHRDPGLGRFLPVLGDDIAGLVKGGLHPVVGRDQGLRPTGGSTKGYVHHQQREISIALFRKPDRSTKGDIRMFGRICAAQVMLHLFTFTVRST